MLQFFELSEAFEPGVIRLGRRDGRWVGVEGARHADLLGTEEVDVFFISPSFLAVLEPLTGWRRGNQVVVEDRQGRSARYTQLIVKGRSGQVRSPQSRATNESDGFADVRGMPIEPDGWDGADLFTPEGSSFILLSQRAADVLRAAQLSNVEIEDASEVVRRVPLEELEPG